MEPKVITWPADPASRGFVDIRLSNGVTIENFAQSADAQAMYFAFETLAKQGYAMIEQPGSGDPAWHVRATIVALRYRDESKGIVVPTTPDLVLP